MQVHLQQLIYTETDRQRAPYNSTSFLTDMTQNFVTSSGTSWVYKALS